MSTNLIDLHGVKHADVEPELLNWIHFQRLPVTVITGNSVKMKDIVKKILTEAGYSYIEGDNYNQGCIKVTCYNIKY